MKVYILGNGFDLAHGLKTSYWDFRMYLERVDLDYLIELEEIFGCYPESNADIVKECLWKEFEYQLGELDVDGKIDDGKDFQLGLEIEDIGVKDTLDDYWEQQYGFISRLNDYLKEWVQQIDITQAEIHRFKLKPARCDTFLTFNYTLLLEERYRKPPEQILHIHGSIDEEDIDPVIGHGRDDIEHKLRLMADEASEEIDEKKTSICNAMANYIVRTQKDTTYYINCNRKFWNSLHDVDTVIIMGHSLGNVDIAYFNEVKKRTTNTTKWIYYYFGEQPHKNDIEEKLGVVGSTLMLLPSCDFFD